MSAQPSLQTRRPAGGALVAAFAALLVVSAAQADSPLERCADSAELARAVERLNDVRQHGDAPCVGATSERQPLSWSAHLAASAQAQASDLAQRDLLSHVDAQQRSLGTRLRQAGYAAASAGENLAAGQPDFDDTLQAWLASPRHCANLMQAEFRDVGLSCVQRRGSRYERFWVAHLGTPVRGTALSAAPRDAVVAAAR